MSENVSPEEVEALVGDDATATPQESVELRDFRQPRRLSQAQQEAIRVGARGCLPTIESELTRWLRSEVTVKISGVGEANANGLFDRLEDPVTILTLDVGDDQGWLIWENKAALCSVMTALGSEVGENPEPRSFSPIESGLVTDLLTIFSRCTGELFDLPVQPGHFSQSAAEFFAFHSPDPSADSQRLFLYFDLEGPGGTSTARLYLPGILPPVETTELEPAAPLPVHLDEVPIQLSAELGSAEVSLADLMKIEPGDVIPLDSFIGDPVDLVVEGNKAGTAKWGNLNGWLALSIESLETTEKHASPRTER